MESPVRATIRGLVFQFRGDWSAARAAGSASAAHSAYIVAEGWRPAGAMRSGCWGARREVGVTSM